MPELMKKPVTDNLISITVTGPSEKIEQALDSLRAFGFYDTSDAVPWREAFLGLDEENAAGDCLAGSRHKEGLTQRELAEKTGIPQRHISEMENGKRTIGRKNAVKFGEALKVNYRVFL